MAGACSGCLPTFLKFSMARSVGCVLAILVLLGGSLGASDTARSASSQALPPVDSLRGQAKPIADVRRDLDGDAVPDRRGDTVTVAGRVTAGQGELPVSIPQFAAVQDSTGGIHVHLPDGSSVERGDSLHVRGVLTHQYGLTQLDGLAHQTVETAPHVPAPMPLTVSAAADDQYEGHLVQVEGRITTKTENDGGRYLLLSDRSGENSSQIGLFVAHRHTSRLSLEPYEEGDRVEVTGLLGQHDYNAPYVEYYQVLPRADADVSPAYTASPYLWWTLYGAGGGAVVAVAALFLLRATVRRRTRELQESQARFQGLANSVPGIIFQFAASKDGTYELRFVSDRAKEMIDVPPNEGPTFDQITQQIPSSHRDGFLEAIGTAVKEKKPWRFEFPFDTPAGGQFWLLGAATPEERGRVVLFNGVLLDITERKKAEARAKLQTNVLRQITEGLPLRDVLAELIEELEAQRTDMLGSVLLYDSAENTIQHGAAPSLPEEYNQAIDGVEVGPRTGSCGSAMHSDSPVIAEDIETDPRWRDYRNVALDHDLRACWSVPIRDSQGQVLGSFAMYYREPKAPSDADWAAIEEARSLARIAIVRHRDSQQLRLLTKAVEQSTEPILITEGAPLDPPGPRIEYVNPAEEQMTGYRKDELIGRTPRLLQGPKTDRDVLDSLRDALEAGEPWEGETVNYRRDGTPYQARWSIAPVHNAQGTIEHWVSVQRDVTQDRQREQELKDAKEAAEEAANLKSAMLANMSHEIRTPLTSIIGFAEVLGGDDASEASTHDLARLIEKSGKRLLETLDTVLTLSKLEAGQMQLADEPVDVVEETDEVAKQFKGQARESDLTLHVETPKRSVEAQCDGGGLQIVLHNLVSNAIKYSEPGGQIWLRVSENDEWTTLEVEDTGIGMDEQQVEQLFEPFRQASEGVARKYEGTGLGLTVTKEAVEQMGGSIDVETEPDDGTCFTVRLPRSQQPTAAPPATDDDPTNPTTAS